jgi:4-amino-4-deoxy-L-arabinose transferase-like glycosyltransferase
MAFSELRWKEILALAGLALLLRVSFLSSYEHIPVSDESDYLELASNLLETGAYSLRDEPTAFRPPAYPAFVAVAHLLFGTSTASVRFIQMLLDIGIVSGLYLLGLRHGRGIAVGAAMIWALFPPAIIYTGLVLSETLGAFLLVALFVALRPAPAPWLIIAGILAGILILVKSWMLLFFIAIAGFLRIRKRSWVAVSIFCAGALVVITPWLIRNAVLLGTPVISTNTGINLYMGNNPQATGAYRAGLPDTLLAVSSDERKYNDVAFALAVDHIAQSPLTFLQRIPLKIAHVFRSEGELLVWAFHPNIRDRSDSFAEKYRNLPLSLTIGVNVLYACILVAGFAGALHFRNDELTALGILFSGILLLTHAIFFGGSRFHFLLMPVMTLLAARLLPDLRTFWTLLPLRYRICFLGVVCFLFSVWTLEFLYVF